MKKLKYIGPHSEGTVIVPFGVRRRCDIKQRLVASPIVEVDDNVADAYVEHSPHLWAIEPSQIKADPVVEDAPKKRKPRAKKEDGEKE